MDKNTLLRKRDEQRSRSDVGTRADEQENDDGLPFNNDDVIIVNEEGIIINRSAVRD